MHQVHCNTDFSSSLDPLETTVSTLRVLTASQHKLHARHLELRDFIIRALETSDEQRHQRRARRLDGCCSSPGIYRSTSGGPILRLNACKDRLCPRCQAARARTVALKIQAEAATYNAPRFVTLTLRHTPQPLSERIDRLFKAFRKLRTVKRWKVNAKGGVYVLQVTRNTNTGTWHPHLHLIVDGEYYNQKALSKDWAEASGGSDVVDIRAIHDKARVAHYLADYVAKPNNVESWTIADVREYCDAMSGRRLVHTFGSKHNKGELDTTESVEREALGTIASFACDTLTVRRWIKLGDEAAAKAAMTLAQQSVTWRRAFGYADPVLGWQPPVVTPDEVSKAVEYCAELYRRPVHWTMDDVRHYRRALDPERQSGFGWA